MRSGVRASDPRERTTDMAYWFNIETRQVETDENRSQNADVMGPYDTEAEAAAALQTARENTQRWDEEERREKEWDDGWS